MPNRFANDVADVATNELIQIYNSVDEISSAYPDSTQFIDAVYNIYSDVWSSYEELEKDYQTPWDYILSKLRNREDFVQSVLDNLLPDRTSKKAESTYTIFDEKGHIDWPRLKDEIVGDLEAEGFSTSWGMLGEIVVEFLLDEIGPGSVKNVARRYEVSEEAAENLLKYLEDTYGELQWLSSNEDTSLEDFQKASNRRAGSKQFQVVFEDSIGGQGVFNIDAIDETEAQQIAEEVTKDHPNIKKILKIREASKKEAKEEKPIEQAIEEAKKNQGKYIRVYYDGGDYGGIIYLGDDKWQSVHGGPEDGGWERVYDETEQELRSVYIAEKSAQEADFDKELPMEVTEVQRSQKTSDYNEGDIILYQGSIFLVLSVGGDYYNLGNLLDTPYKDEDVSKDIVDNKSLDLEGVQGAEQLIESGEESPELLLRQLNKGLEAFEVYKGKIWKKESARDKGDALRKVINAGGEFYADYDDETGMWYVFDTESGFGFANFMDEADAIFKAEQMNETYGLGKYKKATKKTAGTELWQTPEGKYWLLSTVMMERVGPFFDDIDDAIDWAVANKRWSLQGADRAKQEGPTQGSPEDLKKKTSADEEKKPHETILKEPEYEHQLKRPSAIPQPKEVAYLAGQAKEALTKIYKRTIKIREIKDEISKMNAALKTEQAAALPEVKGYLTMAENAFKKADLELNRVYAFKTEVGDPLMTAVYQSPARDIPAPGEVFFNKKDANIILQLLKQNGKITDEVIAEMEAQVDKMNENVKYITEVSRKIYTWPPSKEDLKKLHEGSTKEAISFIDRIKSAWFGLKKFMNKITTLTDKFSDNTDTIRRMLEEKGVV